MRELTILRTMAVCLISAFAQAAQPAPSVESQTSFVPVFVGGQEGYACYRIPAIVATTHGALIAVATAQSRSSTLPAPLFPPSLWADTHHRQPRIDLSGNDVDDAVATYKLDSAGSLYEEHSPQIELPQVAPPKT